MIRNNWFAIAVVAVVLAAPRYAAAQGTIDLVFDGVFETCNDPGLCALLGSETPVVFPSIPTGPGVLGPSDFNGASFVEIGFTGTVTASTLELDSGNNVIGGDVFFDVSAGLIVVNAAITFDSLNAGSFDISTPVGAGVFEVGAGTGSYRAVPEPTAAALSAAAALLPVTRRRRVA